MKLQNFSLDFTENFVKLLKMIHVCTTIFHQFDEIFSLSMVCESFALHLQKTAKVLQPHLIFNLTKYFRTLVNFHKVLLAHFLRYLVNYNISSVMMANFRNFHTVHEKPRRICYRISLKVRQSTFYDESTTNSIRTYFVKN